MLFAACQCDGSRRLRESGGRYDWRQVHISENSVSDRPLAVSLSAGIVLPNRTPLMCVMDEFVIPFGINEDVPLYLYYVTCFLDIF